jgi:NodT family efflux transporter outer membrane factor (OMF) lipoprotein
MAVANSRDPGQFSYGAKLVNKHRVVNSATRSVPLLLACALMCACAVGPDYRAPNVPLPDRWPSQPQSADSSADSTGDAALANWWTALNDPLLNQLIQRALTENRSVRQALARVTEARARRNISLAGLSPTVDSSTRASRTDSDARSGARNVDADDLESLPGASSSRLSFETEDYDAALDARWELDLFGGQRRALQASTAQLGASDADLRDVLVTLLGDVALGYVNVRTLQSRLAFAERNLQAQREVVTIATWRAEAGLADAVDVAQAKTSYAQTQAQIPALEANLAVAMNRIAVLTGQQPGALAGVLGETRPIPVTPADIVTSVPAEVMRRRPDIRRAERRLAAQTAQVGVATAALYPSLSLSGSFGVNASSFSDLMSNNFGSNRFGFGITMPIFRAGALRQNVKAQSALVDQALATYEATILSAFEEVENALVAWSSEQRRHAALVEAANNARTARELALVQYNAGLVDFQTVLNADRQQIASEDALAVSDGELTSNLIRLYKAFGGGWGAFPASVQPRTNPLDGAT